MTEIFTFDKFTPGTSMGSVSVSFDAAFLELWKRIYPSSERSTDDKLPAAISTVVLMHAWRTIVDPKPPGNVHAGQKVAIVDTPCLDEVISTEVRCVSKEDRKGRLFVRLQTLSTGQGGRQLFDAETNLIWAR